MESLFSTPMGNAIILGDTHEEFNQPTRMSLPKSLTKLLMLWSIL